MAVDFSHRDKMYAAPESDLPDSAKAIAQALRLLHPVESSAHRRAPLERLYVGLSRYGPDDDARFMDEYLERRAHGPRLDDASWTRGKDVMRRAAKAEAKAQASIERLRARSGSHRTGWQSGPSDTNDDIVFGVVMTAGYWLVYGSIAAIFAGITMLVIGPSDLGPIVLLFAGLASPLVAPATLALIDLVSQHVRHRDLPDAIFVVVYLAVPVVLTVLASNLSTLAGSAE